MPVAVNVSRSLGSKSLKLVILSGISSPQFSTMAITSVCFYLMRPSPTRDRVLCYQSWLRRRSQFLLGLRATISLCFLSLGPPSSCNLPCDLLLLSHRPSSYGLSPPVCLSDPFPPGSWLVPLCVSMAGIPDVTVTGTPPRLCSHTLNSIESRCR